MNMSTLIKYTVDRGFYNEVKGIDIFLPKELKLVYKEGSIGDFCHKGHNHYMGFMKYNERLRKEIVDANRWVNTYMFGDLLLITITDIKDENNVLPVYDYKEMMEEFDLSNYFIIYSKPALYKANLNFEKVQDEHIYQIIRIKDLQGPYFGNSFMINIESDLPVESTEEYYMMKEYKITDFIDLFYSLSFRKIKIDIKRNAWKEYIELKDKVLSRL